MTMRSCQHQHRVQTITRVLMDQRANSVLARTTRPDRTSSTHDVQFCYVTSSSRDCKTNVPNFIGDTDFLWEYSISLIFKLLYFTGNGFSSHSRHIFVVFIGDWSKFSRDEFNRVYRSRSKQFLSIQCIMIKEVLHRARNHYPDIL